MKESFHLNFKKRQDYFLGFLLTYFTISLLSVSPGCPLIVTEEQRANYLAQSGFMYTQFYTEVRDFWHRMPGLADMIQKSMKLEIHVHTCTIL